MLSMRHLALVALPVVLAAALVRGDDLQARIDQLVAENHALREENRQLRARLDAAEVANHDLQAERTRLEQLAGMTTKGDLVESKIALIQTRYDDAADRTTITSVPERIEGPGGLALIEHRMAVTYSFPGTQVSQPVEEFFFDILTHDNPDDRYKRLKHVTVITDGQSTDVPVTAYNVLDTKVRQGGSRPGSPSKAIKSYDERLRLTLHREAVNRISRATDVRVVLFSTTFRLSRENIATFVAVRERLDLTH